MSYVALPRVASLVIAGAFVVGFASTPDLSAQNDRVFFLQNQDQSRIGSTDVDGSMAFDVISEFATTQGFSIDQARCHVYYPVGNPSLIQRVNTNGTGLTTVLSDPGFPFTPTAVEYDPVGERIYWISPSNGTRIASSKLDGTDVQQLASPADAAPNSIHVDGVGGKMYWRDTTFGGLRRANLDGTGFEDLYQRVNFVRGSEIHVPSGMIYWIENRELYRAPMDGSGTPTLVLTDLFLVTALAIDSDLDRIYWGNGNRLRWTSMSNPGTVTEATPSNAIGIQQIEIQHGSPLGIHADPATVTTGDTLTMTVCGGQPSTLTLLFLLRVNGVPMPMRAALGSSDGFGEFGNSGTVPPGLAGTTMDFCGITRDPIGRVRASLPTTVVFQ